MERGGEIEAQRKESQSQRGETKKKQGKKTERGIGGGARLRWEGGIKTVTVTEMSLAGLPPRVW